MTVYQSIISWLTEILNELKPASFTVIDLERIPNQDEWAKEGYAISGIFSNPNDLHTPMMAGQSKHTEFKSFYLRLPFNELNERKENEDYIEILRKKIQNRNLDGIRINDGRRWLSIEINGGIYPAQKEIGMQYADYLVPLKLVYIS